MGVPAEHISSRIFIVRGQRIMLDADLAALYGVSTGALIQAVKRNLGRFPPDFMFQLTEQELRDLRSQSVISKPRPGRVNIAIMRAFVRLRELAPADAELKRQLDDLERRVGGHDQAIQSIVRAIRDLAAPVPSRRRRIGFV